VTRPAGPQILATALAAPIYGRPDKASPHLGYLRLGGSVERGERPVSGKACAGSWYSVRPAGYVCTAEASIDPDLPVLRAAQRRPRADSPLPYAYGFVRATSPLYLRIPTEAEQKASEFKLLEHLQWYEANHLHAQRVGLGANDVPLDERGFALLGQPLPRGQRLSTQLDSNESYGGAPGDGQLPAWLRSGRQVPNVSGSDVPESALFDDHVRRKTGLALIDAFVVQTGAFRRGFAVTVDLRLVPVTKLEPEGGSQFHGVEMGTTLAFPFAIIVRADARAWQLVQGREEARGGAPVPKRALIPLSGSARMKAGRRFYQTARDQSSWLAADDVALFAPPERFPEEADQGKKWIDVSLQQQTLVLYEGKDPRYATLISSGRDRLGDPKTQSATPRGHFEIASKHITVSMDSNEVSTLAGGTSTERAATLGDREQAGTDRDATTFELRDVPWTQYFDSGFAIHGAYWHDMFGVPFSHGGIDLSPIDARVAFAWTEPQIPQGWHGLYTTSELGRGTAVVIRR